MKQITMTSIPQPSMEVNVVSNSNVVASPSKATATSTASSPGNMTLPPYKLMAAANVKSEVVEG